MTKRMLIDSTHAEETRVVVLDGNRLEDYDVETSTKQQLKGNIYLAKIVRVEPSLQAAFVEFGGGRHGFLAFGEIHPDYYQIPVADRKRLLEMQEEEAREDEEAEEREAARSEKRGRRDRPGRPQRADAGGDAGETGAGEIGAGENGAEENGAGENGGETGFGENGEEAGGTGPEGSAGESAGSFPGGFGSGFGAEFGTEFGTEAGAADGLIEAGYAEAADPEGAAEALPRPDQVSQALAVSEDIVVAPAEAQALFGDEAGAEPDLFDGTRGEGGAAGEAPAGEAGDEANGTVAAEPSVETAENPGSIELIEGPEPDAPVSLGGEHDTEESPDRRSTPRFLRNYKIQEVMRRRQILLVQVVKEERGTKGAALTTYISLAGRFSVLMPNSPRGGGISRKITSAADRRRLKEITGELDLPRGMGLIVRTAGANRPRPEIIRDCEYLLDQWDQIRELTMKSMAPALIYEEASLIKRAIRDVYSRDVDDILVDGEAGWRAARDFMRMLMPTHARKVQLWKDPQPLFARAQVEQQLDAMLLPNVQLRSGGYLVINQTEALVAIDVNSGRSTRERGIEETALRTNLEAAEEAARQLRLRDLAGLIVIDFIDMESRRNNAAVEKKLKDALRNDRARIQIGSISHFGLLEMSRQRLRPSLAETSFVSCPACGGTGHVRGTESAALAVLRGIEDEGAKRRAAEIVVHVAGAVAFYILNHKRARLGEIEARFGLVVSFNPDESLRAPDMRIERVRAQLSSDGPAPISQLAPPEPFEDPDEEVMVEAPDEDEADAEAEAATGSGGSDDEADRPGETAEEGEQRRRKRRRRRRGGARRDEGVEGGAAAASDEDGPVAGEGEVPGEATGENSGEATNEALGEATGEDAGEGAAPDAAEPGSEDGERKRRGRRGGRRRRRPDGTTGEDGQPAEPGGEAPDGLPPHSQPAQGQSPQNQPPQGQPAYQPPMYVGPTPADPFGGANAFDFFDAVEQAEQERALQAMAPGRTAAAPVAPAAPQPEAPEVPDAAAEPGRPARAEPAAAEQRAAEDAVEAEGIGAVAGPPTGAPPVDVSAGPPPVAVTTGASPGDEAPAAAAGGPVVAPPIAPVMIGPDGDAPAEKKKGWWRR